MDNIWSKDIPKGFEEITSGKMIKGDLFFTDYRWNEYHKDEHEIPIEDLKKLVDGVIIIRRKTI